ncbi:DUF445 domain-containing protein [Cohnella sp.]|uniref:DUF445 domain-containing protein n=1 Tax=Cohnella sp. TaxID=1883426 RepID=UPI0035634204
MRTRYIATLSLIVMGIGFIVTLFLPHNIWVDLLKGGFEAGLVGGFADWFAVTALFRHPMGIPIPHTSLLLKNRNKIANSLISALENELLNKESITRKLKQFQLLTIISSGVVKIMSKKSNRTGMISFIQAILTKLPLDRVAALIQTAVADYVSKVEVKSLAEKALHTVMQEGMDETAFDYALSQGRAWISKAETRHMLGAMAQQKISEAKVSGIMGFAVQAFAGFMNEDKLGTMIQQLLLSGIEDLVQPSNPNREKIMYEIRKQLHIVANDEELLARGKQWIANKAQHPDSGAFLLHQLEGIRSRLVETLERDKQKGGRIVVTGTKYVIRKLQAEKDLVDNMEQKLLTFIVNTVEANHYRLGVLLKDNLDRLDDRALVKMLEEKIGGDLQWIRVNGALCGFVIGLILTTIQWM